MAGLQKKTVADIISKRINFWAWSFKNKTALRKLLELKSEADAEFTDEEKLKVSNFQQRVIDDSIVTGGAIASMLLGEEVNDLDIYFTNKKTASDVAWYYLHAMMAEGNLSANSHVPLIKVIDNDSDGVAVFIKSMGVVGEEFETEKYGYFEAMSENALDEFMAEYRKAVGDQKEDTKSHKVKFITSNAITLRNGIQIILRFTGVPDEIHKNYDFVHATNYWTNAGGLIYRLDALQALLERRLVYVGSRFPVASMFRLRKFLRRNFSVTAGEMTKIAYDISKLDLDNPKVLHDQLIGVDYAYFHEVLEILKKNSDKPIDRTYLFTIINEVFQDEEEHTEVPKEETDGTA